MKLYTEDQVVNAIQIAAKHRYLFESEENEIINLLSPIKLPSDKEIEEYVKSTGYYGHCTHEYHEGIEEGAKWMRDKIQGGNK